MQPFRVDPILPAAAFQTYSITTPADTLVRAACVQVGCEAYRRGWRTVLDEATTEGRMRASYIRTTSGRTFTERPVGALTEFRFESGQRCFADHRTRPEFYAVRDGDWRGNPTGRVRQHTRAADWVEDFGEHQQLIADQIERG